MGLGVLAYFPFMLVSGCLAGAFTGECAQMVIKRVRVGMIDERD